MLILKFNSSPNMHGRLKFDALTMASLLSTCLARPAAISITLMKSTQNNSELSASSVYRTTPFCATVQYIFHVRVHVKFSL